ncbi:M57 family metalloprotease [Chitinophaga nivalis]|uniref:M57 family metalloprotease n=1 Tax=Chitinophaga nivalis TaxID=2991709 RepID=A0ABT3IKJ3_9BACT|nr:M57 family metalloprotease [Chitinophaga nivalis]MCW3465979.1 M57 family metalloprotease [Chitinophaga nivalis]MCW3484330.1 M57 family metalloprotease [Chitinophaga nivalis]
MKSLFKLRLCILTCILIFISCRKEKVQVQPKTEISSDLIAQIKAMGFNTNEIRRVQDGYVVEGDIFLPDKSLTQQTDSKKLLVAKSEQYRTNNLISISGTREITVSVTNLPPVYVAAADEAIARYNALGLRLTFKRVASGGQVDIINANLGWGILGQSAGFPDASGNPPSPIKLNAGYIGNSPDQAYMATIIAHEIGHTIGLRHTDYFNRAYSCGSGGNEGDAGVGAINIPGTPTAGDPDSWMLACVSTNVNRPFNTNDQIALRALYGGSLRYGGADAHPVPADYDGDGKADLSVKTDAGDWYIDYANNGFGNWDATYLQYGGVGAHPVPADYDGDGKADLSVKTDAGEWYIDYARNGFGSWDATYLQYGGDPVPADYDGDGKADLSVKTDAGEWYIDYARNGFGAWDVTLLQYGGAGAHPVPADYDGDGKADLSVKTDAGEWYIDYARNGFGSWDATLLQYGGAGAHPVPADYDGDGKADLSVKTDAGEWYIDYASNGFGGWDATLLQYGGADAHPVPADYDGDRKADLSVKTDAGRWNIDYARNGFGSWEVIYQ